MTSSRFILLGLLAVAAPAAAQDGASLDPKVATGIDSIFARFAAPGSPGCALGVMRDGRLVYARGYGLASIELGVPITPATVFDLGSVSKQFTALAVLLLAQDGKLSLDDEIQKLLPEIPRYARPVTIRHLLHHTSGIRDYIDLLFWSGVGEEAVTGDREALEILARQKAPNFAAGAEFLYSNSGFFLLSVIVKRASGKTLREFAAERIFGPLGMRHTFYLDDHAELVPGKASSYAPRGSAGGFQLAPANWEQTGDGGVQTSVEDLLKWEQNFTSHQVGGARAIQYLLSPGVLADGKPITYALGIVVDRYRGLERVSHGGSWAGFRAQFTRFPTRQLAIGALCNVANAGPALLAQRVADRLLQYPEAGSSGSFVAAPPDSAPVRPLAEYVGRYHSDELLADWVMTLERDSLRVRIGPLYQETVTVGARGMVIAGARVRPVEQGGRVTGLSLTSRGARDFILTRTSP